jgi:hypothetical protein
MIRGFGLLTRGSYGNRFLLKVDPRLRSSKFFFEKQELLQARMTELGNLLGGMLITDFPLVILNKPL